MCVIESPIAKMLLPDLGELTSRADAVVSGTASETSFDSSAAGAAALARPAARPYAAAAPVVPAASSDRRVSGAFPPLAARGGLGPAFVTGRRIRCRRHGGRGLSR